MVVSGRAGPSDASAAPGGPSRGTPPAFVELYEEIADCPRCELARARSHTVPGAGPAPAEVMCIGEAPGQREDELGLPFVGASGRFLDQLLAVAGLARDTVYIANVVKCRPPGNRDPAPEEIAACAPFLDRQIAAVDPRVIVTLGRFSMARWFPGEAISRIHGRAKRAEGRLIVPMYHPAAALRNGALRPVIEADFAQLPQLLEHARAGATTSAPAAPAATAHAAPTTSTTPAAERLL
ncbi:MAG: uracil-DNA glycosylase [Dehalococcoidia bacterium]|nr:uracil-DNA glycosylase [Dehalococcoidia bacterium]